MLIQENNYNILYYIPNYSKQVISISLFHASISIYKLLLAKNGIDYKNIINFILHAQS